MLIKGNLKSLKQNQSNKTLPDFWIIGCLLVLVVFGCIMVYSASMYSAELNFGNKFFFLKKQVIGAVLGVCGMIVMMFVPYEKLKKWGLISVCISAILLLLVFVPKIGIENYGARRWVNLGVITIQPSELAKVSFVLYSSSVMCDITTKMKTFKGIFPVVLIGGVFCLLIITEPNMSITMCMGLLLIVMLFVGGASFKHFMLLLIPAMLLVPLLIIIEPYRMKRLIAFMDPFASASSEGFQLVQSLYAIGSGDWFGVGIFNSRQKYLFLPFAESDFIFSIIVEETGFIGALLLLLVYIVLIIRGLKIAKRAKDRFGCYLATGVTCMIAIQVLLNIAVVTGSIPPTGLPLPFISAGSTSLLVFMSAIGVVLNVDRQSRRGDFRH